MFSLLAEWVKVAAGELRAALVDAKACGDYRGHIRAWWGLMTGKVAPEDRYTLAKGAAYDE